MSHWHQSQCPVFLLANPFVSCSPIGPIFQSSACMLPRPMDNESVTPISVSCDPIGQSLCILFSYWSDISEFLLPGSVQWVSDTSLCVLCSYWPIPLYPVLILVQYFLVLPATYRPLGNDTSLWFLFSYWSVWVHPVLYSYSSNIQTLASFLDLGSESVKIFTVSCFSVGQSLCILFAYWSNIKEFCLLPGPGQWVSEPFYCMCSVFLLANPFVSWSPIGPIFQSSACYL